jgi:hypothetical protein
MKRRTMIAALAVIGPASIAVAPGFAQDRSPADARMATERAPVSSGVMSGASSPAPSVHLGAKRKATSQDGPQLQSQKAVRPLTLSPSAAPNLPVK